MPGEDDGSVEQGGAGTETPRAPDHGAPPPADRLGALFSRLKEEVGADLSDDQAPVPERAGGPLQERAQESSALQGRAQEEALRQTSLQIAAVYQELESLRQELRGLVASLEAYLPALSALKPLDGPERPAVLHLQARVVRDGLSPGDPRPAEPSMAPAGLRGLVDDAGGPGPPREPIIGSRGRNPASASLAVTIPEPHATHARRTGDLDARRPNWLRRLLRRRR